MSEEMVIYYELVYSVNKDRMKKLITLNFEEVKIKTSEVMKSDAEMIHLQYLKLSATRSFFMSELRKATQCL